MMNGDVRFRTNRYASPGGGSVMEMTLMIHCSKSPPKGVEKGLFVDRNGERGRIPSRASSCGLEDFFTAGLGVAALSCGVGAASCLVFLRADLGVFGGGGGGAGAASSSSSGKRQWQLCDNHAAGLAQSVNR